MVDLDGQLQMSSQGLAKNPGQRLASVRQSELGSAAWWLVLTVDREPFFAVLVRRDHDRGNQINLRVERLLLGIG